MRGRNEKLPRLVLVVHRELVRVLTLKTHEDDRLHEVSRDSLSRAKLELQKLLAVRSTHPRISLVRRGGKWYSCPPYLNSM